jgi:hypothetical protein
MPFMSVRAEAMKKRSRAGSKPAKVQRRAALKPKGRSAPKTPSDRRSVPAGQTEVERLSRELNEAREQQTAASEVLRVISDFLPICSQCSKQCWIKPSAFAT